MVKPLTGRTIRGYKIGEILGRGGLGDVYRANNSRKEAVAVKVLRGGYMQDPQFQDRFIREIRIMASVEHANVVAVYDFFVEKNVIYLVMQLVEGSTLERHMLQNPYSVADAWDVLQPIASGLQAGHDQNIIHRDIKPDNILVETETKRYYLSDFGLAKRPGIDETLTAAGIAIGTVQYISPEMAASGGLVDARSDQYSLALSIYELLLGKLPFDATKTHQILLAHLSEPPIAPRERHPDFPEPIEAVLLRALSKEKDDRYASVMDFAWAYENALNILSSADQSAIYWQP